MTIESLYLLPVWAVCLIYLSILLGALEFGFFAGKRQRDSWKNADPTNGQIILTSMFAVLGLMLAFTYGAGVSRFDARKKAVVLEVNVMRNAFLLAEVVAEPGRTKLKQALLDYALTRKPKKGQRFSRKQVQELIQKSLHAQSKLWPITKEIAKQMSSASSFKLIAAVSQVINVHTIRLAARDDKLPAAVLLMLLFVAASSLSVAGFNAGISGRMSRWRMTTLTLVLAGVMLVILDFDEPLDGFIRVNDSVMYSVINEMEADFAQ